MRIFIFSFIRITRSFPSFSRYCVFTCTCRCNVFKRKRRRRTVKANPFTGFPSKQRRFVGSVENNRIPRTLLFYIKISIILLLTAAAAYALTERARIPSLSVIAVRVTQCVTHESCKRSME